MTTIPQSRASSTAKSMREAFAAHRINWLDIAIWVVAIGAYFVVPTYLSLGTTVMIMILFTLSLDLAVGYGGIDTLGQGAFFGVGGYAAAYWALHVTGEPISGLLAGAVAAAILGVLSGTMILRTRGLTLIMITLAITSMLEEFAVTAKSITGGDDGLTGYTIQPVLGIFPFDIYFQTAYFYSMAALALCFIIARIVVNSPFGLTVRGIRENPVRMRLLGVPIKKRLIGLYTLSGAMAGVAGALSAQVTGLIGTDTLTFLVSGNALISLILGGFGKLYGAFLGAALFYVFSDRAAAINPFHWFLALGVGLILAVRFMPNGIMGLVDKLQKRGGHEEDIES
jgi:branched-chain amino acid transport system permease protein